MVVYSVVCTECEETRVAREVDGEIVPYRSVCPNCGCEEFESPV